MSSFSGGGDEPSTAELVVVAVSVVVTLSLFGYVAWHAAAVPDRAPPEATVIDTHSMADRGAAVTVAVSNPGSPGLESVTVSVDCADTAITFQHVPADASLTGTFVCPDGTSEASASVLSWVTSQGSRTN